MVVDEGIKAGSVRAQSFPQLEVVGNTPVSKAVHPLLLLMLANEALLVERAAESPPGRWLLLFLLLQLIVVFSQRVDLA